MANQKQDDEPVDQPTAKPSIAGEQSTDLRTTDGLPSDSRAGDGHGANRSRPSSMDAMDLDDEGLTNDVDTNGELLGVAESSEADGAEEDMDDEISDIDGVQDESTDEMMHTDTAISRSLAGRIPADAIENPAPSPHDEYTEEADEAEGEPTA